VAVDHRRVAVVAVVCGLLLGAVDFALQKVLPYPWADLANSGAVWAVAGFGMGLWVRFPWWRSALAAAVLLVLGVPAYYVTAWLWQHDNLSNVWATSSLVWMLLGLVAGVVFGVAGAFATATGWRGMVAVALPGAVLFAEALILLRRVPRRTDDVWTAVIELVLGLLIIVLVARGNRQRVAALAAAIPLAALGFAAFLVGGY
jgi:Family of unknown function (DUF6518)